MAALKYDIAEPLLSDEELKASFVPKSPVSSSPHRRLPQSKLAIIIHALMFLTTLLLLGTTFFLNAKHTERHCKSDLVPSHSKQLFSAYDNHAKAAHSDPIANQIRYTTQSTTADHWHNELLWGEPKAEAEIAWNNGIGGRPLSFSNPLVLIAIFSVRGFRLHPYEAARWNMSDSVRLEPGDDFATIIGVVHNLHCLVSLVRIG